MSTDVTQDATAGRVGAVVIGRNEGERLACCLRSLQAELEVIVYVDSGSTDQSVPLAHSLGATVVELDMSQPFTAARARNAGLDQLVADYPQTSFVQFIDGDCQLVPGWIRTGAAALQCHDKWAAVSGRLRERHPQASVYNMLCDIEWDTPVGEAEACGGVAMMRISAVQAVGGFDANMIAGEEPELCLRLRKRGWTIHRVDADMAWHDAAITRFGQWWRRSIRSGFAYADGFSRHGSGLSRPCIRQVASIVAWALLLPVITVSLLWPTVGWSLLLLAAYPVQWWRMTRCNMKRGLDPQQARRYAAFLMLAKFAQLQGLMLFLGRKMLGRTATIIEYKAPAESQTASSSGIDPAGQSKTLHADHRR